MNDPNMAGWIKPRNFDGSIYPWIVAGMAAEYDQDDAASMLVMSHLAGSIQ